MIIIYLCVMCVFHIYTNSVVIIANKIETNRKLFLNMSIPYKTIMKKIISIQLNQLIKIQQYY